MLISGSTDRMLHIFDASSDDYDLLQTLDAHQTSILDLCFAQVTQPVKTTLAKSLSTKVTQYEKQLRLFSISSDKTLISHRLLNTKFTLTSKELQKHKTYKLSTDSSFLLLAKEQGLLELKSLDDLKLQHTFH